MSEYIADPKLCDCGNPNGHKLTCRMVLDVKAHTALTPRERAAQRLLALAALKKLLSAEDARTRQEDGAAFGKVGQREVAELPDGTPLGNVRADKGAAGGWRLTDAGAFRAWVEATGIIGGVVEQVTTVVDPNLVEETLAELNAGGTELWADPETGEVLTAPPGMAYVQPGPPKLVVTADKGAPEAVRRYLGPVVAGLLGIEQ